MEEKQVAPEAKTAEDPAKEVKRLTRLIKKHEERYVEISKENALLKKQADCFFKALHSLSEQKLERARAESEGERYCEEAVRASLKPAERTVELLKKLEELRNENSRLLQDSITKNEIIRNLQDNLSDIEKLNHEALMKNLNNLTARKEPTVDERIRESEKTSEIIRLKAEVARLREQGGGLSASDVPEHTAFEKLQSHIVLFHKGVQATAEDAGRPHSASATGPSQKQEKLTAAEDPDAEHGKMQLYLKDVIVKFFTYDSKKMENEKRIALNAIFDALNFSFDEKVKTEKLIFKKSMFW